MLPLLISLAYLSLALYKVKRAPESISELSYLWDSKVFSIFCIALAFSLLPFWVYETPENYQFICFLSCCGIVACGVTPFFKETFQAKIHYTGGIIAMLCWLIWMVLEKEWVFLLIDITLIIILTLVRRKSWVFWGEIVGLFSLIGILIRNYIQYSLFY